MPSDRELVDAFVQEGSLGALVERFGYDSKREAREALDRALRALDVRVVKGLDDVKGLEDRQ